MKKLLLLILTICINSLVNAQDNELIYKQKPLEGYGTSNENLINIVPYNDKYAKLGALSETPAPANLQMPDLSKLLTQPQTSRISDNKLQEILDKVIDDMAKDKNVNADNNEFSNAAKSLREKKPELLDPINRVTAVPGSYIEEFTEPKESSFDISNTSILLIVLFVLLAGIALAIKKNK